MAALSEEFTSLVTRYLETIKSDYTTYMRRGEKTDTMKSVSEKMIKEFVEGIHFTVGQKYIRVVTSNGHQRSVHSFIVNTYEDNKFQFGDILKAAGWATPARNFRRGNVFETQSYQNVSWTGA
tara:strand:+ start:94 stop:462 length:369 start_codon:yes stop_codon:yes gene_type:complete